MEFRCRDVGAACRARLKGSSQEELLSHIADHAAKRHGVPRLNQTLVAYALTKVRGQPERSGKEAR